MVVPQKSPSINGVPTKITISRWFSLWKILFEARVSKRCPRFLDRDLEAHDVGLFPFGAEFICHFGGLERSGTEPTIVGISWEISWEICGVYNVQILWKCHGFFAVEDHWRSRCLLGFPHEKLYVYPRVYNQQSEISMGIYGNLWILGKSPGNHRWISQ